MATMDRRQLFKRGFDKAAASVIGAADAYARKKARHWIRPPFALDELDFLLACTRCDACMETCPYGVIFPLPLSRGAEVVGTPALDILNKGCHLCEDWPCVNACTPRALVFPAAVSGDEETTDQQNQENTPNPPQLAIAEIDTNYCLPYQGPECGACRGSCPIPDTLTFVGERPVINADQCVGCGLCREACIADPKAVKIEKIGGQ